MVVDTATDLDTLDSRDLDFPGVVIPTTCENSIGITLVKKRWVSVVPFSIFCLSFLLSVIFRMIVCLFICLRVYFLICQLHHFCRRFSIFCLSFLLSVICLYVCLFIYLPVLFSPFFVDCFTLSDNFFFYLVLFQSLLYLFRS